VSSSPDGSLAQVADELYALPAEEFTAARNVKVKQVRAGGDRDLAAAIQRLARPSAAAALANLVVRQDADAFEPLLELGVALRRATAALDGVAMRTLSRQQQQVVGALVRRAREVARDEGLKVSEGTLRELDDTLRAAIADAGAAEQLMAGRLTGPLQHSGFGPAPTGHLTVVPDRPTRPSEPVTDPDPPAEPADPAQPAAAPGKKDARRARAAQAVEAAETALEDAVSNRKEAANRLTGAEESMGEARAGVERLRADLAEAQREQSRAERDQTKAKDALTKATQAMRAAARRLEDASARLEDLG
jgi:hypothetical protein